MLMLMRQLMTLERRLPITAVMALLVSTAASVACPLCYEAARQMVTDGVQLDFADRAVLATPLGGTNQFRIAAVIKGEDTVGVVITDPVTGADPASPDHNPCLLIRDSVARQWTALGTIPVEYADWLREVAATRSIGGEHPKRTWPQTIATADSLSYNGWRQRVALIAPYLENSNAFAARLAWGELARAPYSTLDGVKSKIQGATVAGWVDDPKLASRRAAYVTLLGFVGGPSDAARLEQKLEQAWNAHETGDLAALIGADLQLRGPSRVDWVQPKYLVDRSRTLVEIEAALLALKVHGDENSAVPRWRVIEAYRAFIGAHPSMAGFVAPQLADWDYWDEASEYVALLKSDAIKDPASEFAVQYYLRRAAEAKAVLR
jgi:hypothetical protein